MHCLQCRRIRMQDQQKEANYYLQLHYHDLLLHALLARVIIVALSLLLDSNKKNANIVRHNAARNLLKIYYFHH